MSIESTSTWTPDEVRDVAGRQKYLIWLILLQFVVVLFIFAGAVPLPKAAADGLAILIAVSRIVIAVLSIYGVYKMAKSLRKGMPILYAIAMLLPLIALLALLHLSAEATRILQENSIRVGLMGANTEDVERLSRQTSTLP